jgi:hypothetical protein
VLDYLRSGRGTPPGFAKARNACKELIDALGRRLKGHP